MEGTKSIFASKTFWGGILAVASGVLGFFGYTLSPDDQQAIISMVTAVSGGIAGLICIWGRVTAKKKIEG